MTCQNCGANYEGTVCPFCGGKQNAQNAQAMPNYQQTQNVQPAPTIINVGGGGGITCPKCGSNNLQAISDVKGNGVKLWKLCLCGIFGLCGAGKTKTEHFWLCNNCGNKFKI
ncbi:MAG: hypothetical protein IJH80_08515 [Ruminococcus sp.]|nr:hypothetical protein [Ruminococcus sp.]